MNIDPSITLTQAHLLIDAAVPNGTKCISVATWRPPNKVAYAVFEVWDGDKNFNGETLAEAVKKCLAHHKPKPASSQSGDSLFAEAAQIRARNRIQKSQKARSNNHGT